MDDPILPPAYAEDPLGALAREDLNRLSVAELDHRAATLDVEAARTRAHRAAAATTRAAADALFRRG